MKQMNDKPNEGWHRPHMKFYGHCFLNNDAVADNLITSMNKTAPDSCVDLAKTILQGKGPTSDDLHHFHFNYHFYASFTMDQKPDAAMVVVHTEHLWNDAKCLNFALGGDGMFVVHRHVSHRSENYQVRS